MGGGASRGEKIFLRRGLWPLQIRAVAVKTAWRAVPVERRQRGAKIICRQVLTRRHRAVICAAFGRGAGRKTGAKIEEKSPEDCS